MPFFYRFSFFVTSSLIRTRELNLNILPNKMCCFVACAKAENANENWVGPSPTSLNLMDLVISKSICDQGAPSDSILPSESGLESFYLLTSSQVCSHRRSEKEASCRNWLYYWEPESLASGGRKERLGCFLVILFLWLVCTSRAHVVCLC